MLRYVSVPQWRSLKKRGSLVRMVGQTSYLHAEYYLHYTHAPATVAVPTDNYVKWFRTHLSHFVYRCVLCYSDKT